MSGYMFILCIIVLICVALLIAEGVARVINRLFPPLPERRRSCMRDWK